MGRINCCHFCVAPKRYPGCHDHCPEYAEEKAEDEKLKAVEAERRRISNGLYTQKAESVAKARSRQRGKKA